MTAEPPLSDLVARAHWHLGLGYFDDEDVIDERGDEDFHEPATCWNCGGQGTIVDCCDDLCHGADWCMHGDNPMCHVCQGEGVL